MTQPQCKTCKHWGDENRGEENGGARDYGSKSGNRNACHAAIFNDSYDRVPADAQMVLYDAERYYAVLYTTETHFCAEWELNDS